MQTKNVAVQQSIQMQPVKPYMAPGKMRALQFRWWLHGQMSVYGLPAEDCCGWYRWFSRWSWSGYGSVKKRNRCISHFCILFHGMIFTIPNCKTNGEIDGRCGVLQTQNNAQEWLVIDLSFRSLPEIIGYLTAQYNQVPHSSLKIQKCMAGTRFGSNTGWM